MSNKIFDLEQRIMNCWNVVDDINDIYNYIGDNEFFTGMDAEHNDKILNLLLGMKELYTVKFEKCFADFEDVTREYHLNRKRYEQLSEDFQDHAQDTVLGNIMNGNDPDWPSDDQRIDIIGQNGNDGAHYECEHKEIDGLMETNPGLTYERIEILRKCLPIIDIEGVEYSQEKIRSCISALIKEGAVDDYDEGLAVVKYWLSMEWSLGNEKSIR